MRASASSAASGREDERPRPAGETAPAGASADGDPLRELAVCVAQLRDCTAQLVWSERDRLSLRIRDALWHVIGRAAFIVVSLAIVVTATSYVFEGLAGGLTVALGGRQWLARLTTGAAGLLALIAVVLTALYRTRHAAHRRRTMEYEARRKRQRIRFGGDVAEVDRPTRGAALSSGAGTSGPRRDRTRASRHSARRG